MLVWLRHTADDGNVSCDGHFGCSRNIEAAASRGLIVPCLYFAASTGVTACANTGDAGFEPPRRCRLWTHGERFEAPALCMVQQVFRRMAM